MCLWTKLTSLSQTVWTTERIGQVKTKVCHVTNQRPGWANRKKTSSSLSSVCCSLEDCESAILDPALKPNGSVAETFTAWLTTANTHTGSRTSPCFWEIDAACQRCSFEHRVSLNGGRKHLFCAVNLMCPALVLSIWPRHFLLFLWPGWRSCWIHCIICVCKMLELLSY